MDRVTQGTIRARRRCANATAFISLFPFHRLCLAQLLYMCMLHDLVHVNCCDACVPWSGRYQDGCSMHTIIQTRSQRTPDTLTPTRPRCTWSWTSRSKCFSSSLWTTRAAHSQLRARISKPASRALGWSVWPHPQPSYCRMTMGKCRHGTQRLVPQARHGVGYEALQMVPSLALSLHQTSRSQ